MCSVHPFNIFLLIFDLDDLFFSNNDGERSEPVVTSSLGAFGSRPVQSDLVSRIERSSSVLLVQFLLQFKISGFVGDLGDGVKQFQALTDDFSIRGGRV